jgi:cytochrome P450
MKPPLPPGPPSGLLGLHLARRLRDEPLSFTTEICRQYGDVVSFRVGPIRLAVVNHPDLIREVLSARSKVFPKLPRQTRIMGQIAGNGLIVSQGELWLRQRRLVQPAFHPRRLDGYAAVTVAHARRLAEGWRDGEELSLTDAMTRLSLTAISEALFGVDTSDRADALGRAVATGSAELVRESGSMIQLPDWLPLPGKRRKRAAFKFLRDFIDGVIRERRAAGTDRGDLLSMLLHAVDEEGDGQGMSDRQARDEALTMFNAGHDTTAAGLTWTWYLLATHPDEEARLLAEVDAVLGGRPATAEDVARLPYAQMVVKESLRLYPPSWTLMAREAAEEVELGGYRLPKGTWVFLFLWVTHRDGRFFPDPERFDPERFAPGRAEQIPPFAWFPFGGGPHVCIGMQLALTQMTLIVATILQHARLPLAPGQGVPEPEPSIAIRPKGGLRVRVTKRAAPPAAVPVAAVQGRS